METITIASSTFHSTLALPGVPTLAPTDSSSGASRNRITSNLGSITIIDFGPKDGLFYAHVRLDTQEIPRLRIYFDSTPARTVMISAGENIVELRGYVPSNLVGTIKVSVQIFCDEEIVDSAPLGVFNVKDLKSEAATSFPMVLGKHSKEPEVNVRPSKRSSVLSGPQWDYAPSPVGQTCKQGDVQMPVSLHIEGDLSSMATNWSQEEYGVHRRLVRFWRQQNGADLRVNFAPIRQEEYTNGATVISCIHSQEDDECYFTSVDIIHLLESLIGTDFSIEEKNRVRRNVEGFKPTTVSKNSKEHNEFFNLIMSFPQPRPRNIEKDVKVFPWRTLTRAIEKIVGKYVYSSATGKINEEKSNSYYTRSPRRSQTSYFTSQPNFRSSVFDKPVPSYSSSSISSSSSSVSSPPDTPLVTPPLPFSGSSSQHTPMVVEDGDSTSDEDYFSIIDPKNIVPFSPKADATCSSSSPSDPLSALDESFDMPYFMQLPMADIGTHVSSTEDSSLWSSASMSTSNSATESFTEEDFSAFLDSLNTQMDLNDLLDSIVLPETALSSSNADAIEKGFDPLDLSLTAPQTFDGLYVDQNALQLSLEGEHLSSWDLPHLSW